MSDHMTKPLKEFADDVVADGIVDADEIAKIKARLYDDGIIDQDEADFLFAVNDAVSGNANDPGWGKLFADAIADFVLKDEKTPGEVDDDEAQYLISKMQADGVIDPVELGALAQIAATAAKTPESLQVFTLESLKTTIIEDGIVDEAEVKILRKVIYGTGGGGGEGVDRKEADFLFEINDAVTGNANHPSWQSFFVEAITKHVLEDDVSPGEIDDDEAIWLIGKVEADGSVDEIEKVLLKSIKDNAKAITEKLTFKFDLWKI